MCGARLGGEHGEDAGAAADVEDDLVLEEVLVVPHRVPVGQGSHLKMMMMDTMQDILGTVCHDMQGAKLMWS